MWSKSNPCVTFSENIDLSKPKFKQIVSELLKCTHVC